MDEPFTKYSHEVMQEIKVKYVMDGDLAATIGNAIGLLNETGLLGAALFCDHTLPKLEAFMKFLKKELDVEHREEKV